MARYAATNVSTDMIAQRATGIADDEVDDVPEVLAIRDRLTAAEKRLNEAAVRAEKSTARARSIAEGAQKFERELQGILAKQRELACDAVLVEGDAREEFLRLEERAGQLRALMKAYEEQKAALDQEKDLVRAGVKGAETTVAQIEEELRTRRDVVKQQMVRAGLKR